MEAYKQEFERLIAQDPNGLLKPEAIVAAAQDPNNVFHGQFTWDDDEAARRWRLEQARFLIKNYTVVFEPLNIRIRGFVSLESDRQGNGGFRRLSDVMERVDLKQEMLSTALRELEQAESKYKHLTELDGVWSQTHIVARKLGKKQLKQELKINNQA